MCAENIISDGARVGAGAVIAASRHKKSKNPHEPYRHYPGLVQPPGGVQRAGLRHIRWRLESGGVR